MEKYSLFFAPETCARVALIALVQSGVKFKSIPIDLLKGDHLKPEFLKLNPKGKVPALIIDKTPLCENVAIIQYLNDKYPQAGILPKAKNPLEKYQQMADLMFCSATLHPILTRIRYPHFFVDEQGAPSLAQRSKATMARFFAVIEAQLEDKNFWYGDDFSIQDAYINWVFWRVSDSDFDVSKFPNFQAHHERVWKNQNVIKALEIELDPHNFEI